MLAKVTRRRCAVSGAVGLALLGAGLPSVVTDGSGPDLSRFYRQKIKWSKCVGMEAPADLQCGKVTVPVDYAKPRAGTLELALARYRAATKHKHGSVLLNFGGPGGAGVPALAAGGDDFMNLTDEYDVVSFDPRGVGRSSPVSCGNGTDEALAATDDDSAFTRDPQAVLGRLRKAADQCTKHSGPVLPHIGTVNVSRDLDIMRQALGDKKLNYLGFSYGSRLGAVYAAQFPKKVGRLVLDGVDTLTEPLAEQGVAGAAGQQTALEDFVDWCVKDIACPFGTDARGAREQVLQLVASLDEDPVPTDFGPAFTGQDLVGAISQALYSKDLWPSLERALAELVEQGDTTGVLGFAGGGSDVLTRARPPSDDPTHSTLADVEDVPFDNLPAALMAVNCADDPDRPGADRITKDLARLRAAYVQASPVFGRYRLTEYLICYGRPKGTDFIREKVRDVRTPKILLVGTRGDPATPYRWTVETAKRLGDSAVVLDNKGEGHTGYGSSKCVRRKVDDFLLYGSLPPDGSSCGPERDG
ncbi:pimeloyl-ACP methyl ester carboxylesterase [Streptomyces sp. SAI-144]|uniref:alpha/beta hydrolase n=1 Tax=unclassified Streptomyces TaxID=2593676 RepID=UPI002473D82F|nr:MULTISPECIES: alpha/beta hydrolase [unclassified Streptomyces]MDH6431891.1 pimeloyl-ACP methyl ester carboxylesterase [Streptomyces sp. SAI-144]MDH6492749.1 pimeloyl-ACP methyl ester carboxylesterase [Streptomyces sp. SAI-127]